MTETIETIKAWFKKNLPLATYASQMKKCEEEYHEYKTAETREKKIEELADWYIAVTNLDIFDKEESYSQYLDIVNEMVDLDLGWDDVYPAVDAKMKINRSRTWEYKNGQYRHKDEDHGQV